MPQYDRKDAVKIARRLAESYPEHGFIIYRDEAEEIGLKPQHPSDEQEAVLSRIIPQLAGLTAIGKIQWEVIA